MKTVVVLRGEDPGRKLFGDKLETILNNDGESVLADRASMRDFDYGDVKAADKSCKNFFKRWAINDRPVLILDNDSSNPQDWRSYQSIAQSHGNDIRFKFIGIDLSDKPSSTFAKEMNVSFTRHSTLEELLSAIKK